MVRFKVRIDSFTLFTLYLFYISSVPMALAVSSCLNVAHPAAFVECFRVLWCSGQVRMTHVGGITLCNFQYRQKYEIYMLGSLSVVQWSKYFFLIFLIVLIFFVFLCWRPMTDMNLTLFRSVWFSGGAQERQALELFQTTDNATTRAAAHHLIGLACEQVDTVLNAMRRNATYVKSLLCWWYSLCNFQYRSHYANYRLV